MVVLIDANVIIDFLCKRPEFYSDAEAVIRDMASDDVKGYVAFHTISNLWYIMRDTPKDKRRKFISSMLNILTIATASHNAVEKAVKNESFSDFEDCLQEACASNINADYIITRNIKDFESSSIKSVLPKEYLRLRKS